MTRALAKSPGARYQRCLDFVQALRAACQLAPGDGPSRPTQRILVALTSFLLEGLCTRDDLEPL